MANNFLKVHQRLRLEYGCPIAGFHELDPLNELVSALLSTRTKDADAGRAFRSLRSCFPTWQAARDAQVDEIQRAIPWVTWLGANEAIPIRVKEVDVSRRSSWCGRRP